MALRFRVAGFPVQIHPLFFLTTLATGMTGWTSPGRVAVWFCVVFISVLVHELGHALAFRRFGHAASISLHGLGGTTRSEGGKPLTHRQDLWISLAGPVAGFLLGGLVLALAHYTPLGQAGGLVRSAVRGLLWANFAWGVFNLLPVLPLDGGHVLAAVIRERGGPRWEWLIHAISLVTAACGVVLAIVWKEPWLGMFALVLGVVNVNGFARAWIERGYILKIRAASRRASPITLGEQAAPREEDFPEPPYDPRFVGELLLGNGLPELAISPLRTAFQEAPTAQTGHALVTALLEARRYADLTRLLAAPSQQHLGDETLSLIATRADAADQPTLAASARELRQSRSKPLPARGAHDSEKPG